ncbi:MAG: DoxX family protein [bacterium]|nr:DoxX family protein [bacterium]
MSVLIDYLMVYQEWGYFLLRAVIAVIFLAHGYPKIKNLRQTGENFSMMGFYPGMLWGTLAALLEFFGGIALLLGLYVPVLGALFAVEMLVAACWKMRRGQGLVNGYELDLLLTVGSFVLATSGAGALSLDMYVVGLAGY